MSEMTIGSIVSNAARVVPTRTAATFEHDSITFAKLDRDAQRVAYVLADRGIERGDRVVWSGTTSIDAVTLFVALARIGAVFCPVNPGLSAVETERIVTYADPRLVIDDDELRAIVGATAPRAVPLDMISEDAPHVIFFTSGSTGTPKGVVLSHRVNFLRSFPGVVSPMRVGGTVCMFPLFHMAAWSIALGCWQDRRPVHLVGHPNAAALLDAATRHDAERLYAIPAVWRRLLDHGLDASTLPGLRYADTGTSATPPELLDQIRDALPHTETRVFYGSTEAGPTTLLAHHELAAHPGGVGRPQPGVEVRCDASTGHEVWVRSSMLMDGYFALADATAAALGDGWYRSGDLGVIDADGYLSITGRARDVIRTGGETVAPAEVEAVLATHPAVGEIAVVGVPDSEWGEHVCACVVLAPGASLDLDTIRAHGASHLAGFKLPRRLVLLDALPRTSATGQIQRTLLAERLGHE